MQGQQPCLYSRYKKEGEIQAIASRVGHQHSTAQLGGASAYTQFALTGINVGEKVL
jgi:hypothetical protein